MRKLFLIGFSWLFVSPLFAANIPAQITYQGTLKRSGVPADGAISMEFQIINADDSIIYWNSQKITVNVKQGLFSTILSPQNTLNPQNPQDWANITPYIQVIVFDSSDKPVTLGPPEPITATMYSLVAGTIVDNSVSTPKIADGAITQQKLAASIGTMPAGAISAYGGTTDPTGWLICDGRDVDRATYAALFAAIGVAFGSGNGTTTFTIPDLRGQFLRGQDQAAGRDPDTTTRTPMHAGGNSGNAIGSIESQQIASHTHSITDPGHDHSIPDAPGNYGFIRRSKVGESVTTQFVDAASAGTEPDLLATPSGSMPKSTTGITINSYGGSETRPLNAYVNWIIRT